MIERFRLLCALLLIAAAAAAESPWEIRLPGEPLLPLDAHSLALGGATDARWDIEAGLPGNPAQLVRLDGFTFASVIQMRRIDRDLPGGLSWTETRQSFPAFQISASLPKGIHIGAGYRADLRSRGSFDLPAVEIEGETVEESYSQIGDYHRFPLTVALPLGKKVRLGGGLTLERGNLTQEWLFHFPDELTYENPELGFVDRTTRRIASWHGTSLNLGVQVRPAKWVSLSARFTSAADVSGENVLETAGVEADSVAPVSGRVPVRYALGIAGYLPAGGIFSAQWEHEAWAEAELPVGDGPLLNVDRIGIGCEWVFRHGYRGKKETPLRLGFRRSNHPGPDPFTGSEIGEMFYSIGTGFNLRDGRGSVDLTFFLQNLAVDGGDTENRIGVALSLRTSEIWTKRTTPF